MILLLLGGDKKSQKKDTSIALEYWTDYIMSKKTLRRFDSLLMEELADDNVAREYLRA